MFCSFLHYFPPASPYSGSCPSCPWLKNITLCCKKAFNSSLLIQEIFEHYRPNPVAGNAGTQKEVNWCVFGPQKPVTLNSRSEMKSTLQNESQGRWCKTSKEDSCGTFPNNSVHQPISTHPTSSKHSLWLCSWHRFGNQDLRKVTPLNKCSTLRERWDVNNKFSAEWN